MLFELWRNTAAPNRKLLYQGLVQACAALHLMEKGKFCGARKVMRSAVKNLLPFEVLKKPFNIAKLISDLYAYFENMLILEDPNLDASLIDMAIIAKPKIEISGLKEQAYKINQNIG